MGGDIPKDQEERRTGAKDRREAEDRRGDKRVVTVTKQRRESKKNRRQK